MVEAPRRLVTTYAPPPARLLEVGCGAGYLARELAERGYEVIAIDPDAPTGDIFQKTTLEEFHDPENFDVVVANRSLHHIPDLAHALNKIYALLGGAGVLILNEFAWDQMDERTADWYLSQVNEPGPEDESLLPGKFPDAWVAEHDGLHGARTIRAVVGALFEEQLWEWTPYLAEHYLKRPHLLDDERDLVRADRINPVGFHYVGKALLDNPPAR